jgi:N-acetyl-alpha-D-muramate 1-phosphate uridylyltransferase
MSEVCAVVLAAGEGRRLRPLTERTPKALCPVGNVPLLELTLARVAALVPGLSGPDRVAVNAWYLADQVVAAVGDRAHVSVESGPRPLGTAGGLGALRDWIGGRPVLVANVDAYLAGGDLAPLLDGWDGEGTRMLVVPGPPAEFSGARFAGCSALPWRRVRELPAEPDDLVRTVWRPAEAAGELTLVDYGGRYLDTGTPGTYLAANLDAAAAAPDGRLVAPDATVTGRVTHSVVGAGAVVEGSVERCVVWPGGHVGPDEHLVGAIRVGTTGTVCSSPDEGAPE